MQEAGPVTFFRTIFIILLVIYGLRFIARYVMPLLLKRAVQKAQERVQQYGNPHEQTTSSVKVGETVIDKKPPKTKKRTDDSVGDYVDFEEVD